MEVFKPWYLSRTIWASAIAVAATLASALGFPLESSDVAALPDAILQAVAAVAGVIAILGRLSASMRIR
ncbi:MAG: hypothetical protein M9895_12560 [Aquamicrobium sp.]|jgi:hypothetical protein|uniref:hypothetical protein n=1 Tax=Aquamicrobium sp. TaxID=1872579 RepID=UPI00349E9EB3|nr:hypothetical protein [Aquamicrobium sp.]MCO5156921.1 hypothetical protein [Aquamicrobium sp.]